jgi:hypothetical protein
VTFRTMMAKQWFFHYLFVASFNYSFQYSFLLVFIFFCFLLNFAQFHFILIFFPPTINSWMCGSCFFSLNFYFTYLLETLSKPFYIDKYLFLLLISSWKKYSKNIRNEIKYFSWIAVWGLLALIFLAKKNLSRYLLKLNFYYYYLK